MSTHSLDPCLWEESDHLTFGTPHSSSITPAGSVHKSRRVQCGAYVGAVEDMVYVVCVGVAEGA